MTAQMLLVAAAVALGFVVESTVGFGAMVVGVALGSQWMPVRALVAAVLPLNLALSAYFALRDREHIARRVLTRRIAPWMLAGMPVGVLLGARLPESALKRVFGALVLALASVELVRLLRSAKTEGELSSGVASALLGVGGVVHGMFGTGGPLVVYVASRWISEKRAFRATLSALWFALNALLAAAYVVDGTMGAASLRVTLVLAPALAVGMLVGDALHRRVREEGFRKGVYAVLVVAGTMLVTRG